MQSVLCSLYCGISSVLLFVQTTRKLNDGGLSHHDEELLRWNYADSVAFFLAVISIPFPAICIRLHHEYKNKDMERRSCIARQGSIQTPGEEVIKYPEGPDGVKSWLESLKLPQYISNFEEAKFEDMSDIKDINEGDLVELNIPMGHRKRIMRYRKYVALSLLIMHQLRM